MKTFLFDLDGTLINSLGDLADSVNHVLEKRGDVYKRQQQGVFPVFHLAVHVGAEHGCP